MFLESKWWEFCIVALFIFMGCVVVNYILKKVNETRIEERFCRLLQKTSVSTQVQEPILAIESIKPKANTNSNNSARFTGISLVFNKEENMLLGVKRQASTLLPKKTTSWNLEEILDVSHNEEDGLYHKISIISVIKNKSDQVANKPRNMIHKGSNEMFVGNNSNSQLSIISQDTRVQNISSGFIKLKLDRKLNLTAYNLDNNKHKSNSIDNLESKVSTAKVDQVNIVPQQISDLTKNTTLDNVNWQKDDKGYSAAQERKEKLSLELSSGGLTSHRLEAKSANTVINLESGESNLSHKADDTFFSMTYKTLPENYFEPSRSNLVDVLKQTLWHRINSLTKCESHIIYKSEERTSKINLTVNTLDNPKLNCNSVNDSKTDNHKSVVSKVSTSNEKKYKLMEDTQQRKEILSHNISSNCLTTHELETKTAKTQGISTKNIDNSELKMLAECQESYNVRGNSQITVNTSLHTNDFQSGKHDQVNLLKHSMWHSNNCLTISDSHIPCKSEELLSDFIIEADELSTRINTLKNEDQNSFVSTNCQHTSHDLTKTTNQVKSNEINSNSSTKSNCSE